MPSPTCPDHHHRARAYREPRQLEAIADEKSQIFTGLVPGGVAIIPADSEWAERMIANARALDVKIVTFGRAAGADVRLLDAIPAAGGGSLVTADLGDRRVCYTVAEPGEHWIVNSLGVIAAVRAAGGDLASAGLALAEMGGLKGRGAGMCWRFRAAARC